MNLPRCCRSASSPRERKASRWGWGRRQLKQPEKETPSWRLGSSGTETFASHRSQKCWIFLFDRKLKGIDGQLLPGYAPLVCSRLVNARDASVLCKDTSSCLPANASSARFPAERQAAVSERIPVPWREVFSRCAAERRELLVARAISHAGKWLRRGLCARRAVLLLSQSRIRSGVGSPRQHA